MWRTQPGLSQPDSQRKTETRRNCAPVPQSSYRSQEWHARRSGTGVEKLQSHRKKDWSSSTSSSTAVLAVTPALRYALATCCSRMLCAMMATAGQDVPAEACLLGWAPVVVCVWHTARTSGRGTRCRHAHRNQQREGIRRSARRTASSLLWAFCSEAPSCLLPPVPASPSSRPGPSLPGSAEWSA